MKAYPELALPTRFSELERHLKIPDRILDLALEKLVLVDLPGNVEEAFECYEGFLRRWKFLQDNVNHILGRNLGRREEWESFDQFITPESIAEYKMFGD